jgi:uncharacterized protein YbjT (DUF2867 family)
MILITGATGIVGSEVVKAVFPEGVHKVVADLGDGDLAPVLDGVTAVFLVTRRAQIADYDRRVVAAAKRASVERVVKLSVRNVGHEGSAARPVPRPRYPRRR